jgi:hypothetical protein
MKISKRKKHHLISTKLKGLVYFESNLEKDVFASLAQGYTKSMASESNKRSHGVKSNYMPRYAASFTRGNNNDT